MAGKEVPSHSVEAEKAVIGAIMLKSSSYYKAIEHIQLPEMFYIDKHLLIFQALAEMITAGKEADIISLSELLRAKGQLEQIGGRGYLLQISKGIATSADIESHAMIVLEHYTRRKQVHIVGEGFKKRKDENPLAPMLYIREELDKLDNYIFNEKPEEEKEHIIRVAEETKQRARGEIETFKTPFYDLNKHVELEKGDVVVIGARPSMGKTAFALTLAEFYQKTDPVLFLSAEMRKDALTKRRLSYYSSYSFKELNNDEDKVQEATELLLANSTGNLIIDDNKISYDTIRGKVKRAVDKGCKYVFYDYMQLIPSVGKDKKEKVANLSNLVANIGKEFGVISFELAQLNRDSAKNKYGMALIPAQEDLKETGDLEQDADHIWLLHRPEKYSSEKLKFPDDNYIDVDGLAFLKIAKQRNGESQQLLMLDFDGKRMKFNDRISPEYAKYID